MWQQQQQQMLQEQQQMLLLQQQQQQQQQMHQIMHQHQVNVQHQVQQRAAMYEHASFQHPRHCQDELAGCGGAYDGKGPSLWMQVLDANSGRMYYFNTVTGETSWFPPSDVVVANPTQAFVYPVHQTDVKAGANVAQSHSQRLDDNSSRWQRRHGEARALPPARNTNTGCSADQVCAKAISEEVQSIAHETGEFGKNEKDEDDDDDDDDDDDCFDGLEERCWGRPRHLRKVSGADLAVEAATASHSRFRSLSSIDRQSLEQLAAYGRRRRRQSRHAAKSAAGREKVDDKESSGAASRPRGASFASARGGTERRMGPLLRCRSLDAADFESAITNPDATEDLLCVSAVIHAHIVQFVLAAASYIHPRFALFEEVPGASAAVDAAQASAEAGDPPADQTSAHAYAAHVRRRRRRSSAGMPIPTRNAIFAFLQDVYLRAQMEKECILMSFVYLERLLKATRGQLVLNESNWKGVVLSTMILASKVWDDLSMSNGDFAKICPAFSLKRINQIEVCLLEAMAYEVRVSSSQYARYFFQLRAMRKVLGIPVIKTHDDSASANQARARKPRRNTVFNA